MESLETRLAEVIDELSCAGDWTDRYRLLVEWGEVAEPLPEGERSSEWEVAGCSSPLWLKVERTDGRLRVRGYSPGLLPRALVALVMRLFDGVSDTHATAAELIDRLGLRRHLSPTRLLVLERMLDRALGVSLVAP